MKNLIFFFILGIATSCAQTNAFNTKRAYAMDGYDVVSNFNGNPMEGTKDYVAEFDSVTFKFSSEENLNLFKEKSR